MKKIIVVSGYFNPVHSGHISLFKEAKKLADFLFVILNNDKQVKLKGSFPFMSQKERKIVLESIKYIDSVFLSIDEDKTVLRSIKKINQQFSENNQIIFANGGDRTDKNVPEIELCEKLKIKTIYNIGNKKKQSSSSLISSVKKCQIHHQNLVYCQKCIKEKK